MSRGNFDKYITIFSPEGSLYQVEYAFKAVKYPGLTTIAVRGEKVVFVLTQHQVPDALMKSETITSLYNIDGRIGACITGRAPDGKSVINKCRQEAADYKYKFGLPVPPAALAKRMGDMAQVATQEAGMRPMGVSLTLIGMDLSDATGELVPQIFKVDPAGYYVGYHAVATGQKEIEATAQLEKQQKSQEFNKMSRDEAAMTALHTLQHVTGMTLKSSDVELAEVAVEQETIGGAPKPVFRRVAAAEIDGWLTTIAERD